MDHRDKGGIGVINCLKTLRKSKQISRKGLTGSSLQLCLVGLGGRRKRNSCHKKDVLFTV